MARFVFILFALLLLSSSTVLGHFEDHLMSVTDHSINDAANGALRAVITKISTKDDKEDIAELLKLWTDGSLDPGLGQGTILGFKKKPGKDDYSPNRPGWRIDIQQNGAFKKFGIDYYGLAIQNSISKNNKKQVVFSSALVPVNENVGAALIRQTFQKSMDTLKVAMIKKGARPGTWEIDVEN